MVMVMVMVMVDITNQTFGRFTITGKTRPGNKAKLWEARCSCGNVRYYRAFSFLRGHVTDCGCDVEKRRQQRSKAASSHGGTKTRLYSIWHGMKQRCEYPKHTKFMLYGGRGIRVCDAWHDFVQFREWALTNGYDFNLTLDRIDPNGSYEASNCRWVSYKIQNLNRRQWRIREG